MQSHLSQPRLTKLHHHRPLYTDKMSKDKITPKNLHYDTSLPPFLARLQAQNTNQDGRQDYHAARPKKPRDAEADKEDEPVYFDEKSGETLTKGEWEEREKFGGGDGGGIEGEGDGGIKGEKKDVDEKEKEKEKVAAIGGLRKRKAGKVVGSVNDDEEQEEQEDRPAKKLTTNKKVMSETKAAEGKKGTTKIAKKAKKVALSFGDDE